MEEALSSQCTLSTAMPYVAVYMSTSGDTAKDALLIEKIRKGTACCIAREKDNHISAFGVAVGSIKTCISGTVPPENWKEVQIVVQEEGGLVHKMTTIDTDNNPIFKIIDNGTEGVVHIEVEDKWTTQQTTQHKPLLVPRDETNMKSEFNEVTVCESILCGYSLPTMVATVSTLTQCDGISVTTKRRCERRKRVAGKWLCFQHQLPLG